MFWSETLCQSIQCHHYINSEIRSLIMMWPLHREWRSCCHGTPALLEAEQIEKRHPGSGRPQEEPRRNCLSCKPGQEPRAVSARESWMVLQCPSSPGHSQDHAWPCTNLAVNFLCTTASASLLLEQLQTCGVVCSHIQQAEMWCFTPKHLNFT